MGVDTLPMSALVVPPPPLPPGDWPAQGAWTYEDYLRLPDTPGLRYEIIKRVLYVSDTPRVAHQDAVVELTRTVGVFVKAHSLGRFLVAPVEARLGSIAAPVQPDVLFVRAERTGIIAE